MRRERARGHDDRVHYENEANQVRRIAQERAATEIERIRDEEETKRKVLAKKHAVRFCFVFLLSFTTIFFILYV